MCPHAGHSVHTEREWTTGRQDQPGALRPSQLKSCGCIFFCCVWGDSSACGRISFIGRGTEEQTSLIVDNTGKYYNKSTLCEPFPMGPALAGSGSFLPMPSPTRIATRRMRLRAQSGRLLNHPSISHLPETFAQAGSEGISITRLCRLHVAGKAVQEVGSLLKGIRKRRGS